MRRAENNWRSDLVRGGGQGADGPSVARQIDDVPDLPGV